MSGAAGDPGDKTVKVTIYRLPRQPLHEQYYVLRNETGYDEDGIPKRLLDVRLDHRGLYFYLPQYIEPIIVPAGFSVEVEVVRE